MQTVCNLVLFTFLVHCSVAFSSHISEGQLRVIKITRQRLEGEFWNELEKVGIQFQSEGNPAPNYISITSLRDGRDIFSSALLDDGITLTSVMGQDYLIRNQHSEGGKSKEEVYHVPRTKRGLVLEMLQFGVSIRQLSRAGYLDSRGVGKASTEDLRLFLESVEARQIHQTALELGKRGLYGIDSTGTMIFYILAMRIANIHSIASTQGSKPANLDTWSKPANQDLLWSKPASKPTNLDLPRSKPTNLDLPQSKLVETSDYTQTPCRVDSETLVKMIQFKILAAGKGLRLCENTRQYCKTCPGGGECSGGCGVGCECWEMVCGDCCAHRGCHGHNACNCRPDKAISFSCFNVFGFKCDATYTC